MVVTAVVKKKKADLFLVFVLHSLWSKFNRRGWGERKIHKSLQCEIHQSMMLSPGSISFSKGNVLLDVICLSNQADYTQEPPRRQPADGLRVTGAQRPLRTKHLPTCLRVVNSILGQSFLLKHFNTSAEI